MAKFTTSGLIFNVRGKLGDFVFSSLNGTPVVRRRPKKVRNPRTKSQIQTRKIFSEVSSGWWKLSLIEKAEWCEYAKKFRKSSTISNGGIIRINRGRVMTGQNAYNRVNILLISVGFKPREKPFFGQIGNPPLLGTDLTTYAQYKNEIRFKVWLPRTYSCKCVAQIWTKRAKIRAYSYVAKVTELSTIPTEVVIDKIRICENKKVADIPFKELEKCELYLQMRTIAENGEVSMRGTTYRLEVKS